MLTPMDLLRELTAKLKLLVELLTVIGILTIIELGFKWNYLLNSINAKEKANPFGFAI